MMDKSTLFALLNWLGLLLSIISLIYLYCQNRWICARPSFILIAFSVLFYACPLALKSNYYFHFLLSPWILPSILYVYIGIGLLYLLLVPILIVPTPINTRFLTSIKPIHIPCLNQLVLCGLCLMLFSYLIYFLYLPWPQTGLYNILFNPKMASIARTHSLKTLHFTGLAYLISVNIHAIAPIITSLLGMIVLASQYQKRYRHFVFASIVFIMVLCLVSVPGERAPAAWLFIILFIMMIANTGYCFKPLSLLCMLFLIFIPIICLTLARERYAPDVHISFMYIYNNIAAILKRALITPFNAAVWHVDYVQRHNHFFGLGAIHKIARLVSIPVVHVDYIIGKHYVAAHSRYSTAPCGYLFAYYSYFGWYSLPFSILAMLLLDLIVYSYHKLQAICFLPLIAITTLSCFKCIQTTYLEVLASGGLIIMLACLIWVSHAYSQRTC